MTEIGNGQIDGLEQDCLQFEVSGKKVFSRSSSGAVWLWRYGVPGQWRRIAEKDCSRIGAMNFKGDLIGQFAAENKVMSWNEKNSNWEDFQGEAFFINSRNNLEWFKDGSFTDVATSVEQVAFSAQSKLAFIIKKDNKSIWKWNYGTAEDWAQISANAQYSWLFKNLLKLENDGDGSCTLQWWNANGDKQWTQLEFDSFKVAEDGRIMWCKSGSCEFIGVDC